MSADHQRPQVEALAAECLGALRLDGPWEDLADRLARAAADPNTALPASRALFAGVVEPLADSFDSDQARGYVSFFSRVLRVARKAPGFEAVDAALARSNRDSVTGDRIDWERVRRVIVLSRVTLGADIAVSSVLLRAALEAPSRPEVMFAAGAKNLELFAGEPRIGRLEAPYPRGGTLVERLAVWIDTQRAIAAAAEDLGPGELLVLDPDSRVTQLGLLPVAPACQQYVLFNSRSYREGELGPLGAIAAEWAEERLGALGEAPLPWLALPLEDVERAAKLRSGGEGRIAAVNFGVGGNDSKRVADPFEEQAVGLLRERGYRVVIDAGAGEEERRRAERLASGARAILHQGSFTSFAAITAVADLFIGYDSGAAHAAAALGVRVIDVFAGAPSELMRSRWSPWGKRPALVLPVDSGEGAENVLWRLRELLS